MPLIPSPNCFPLPFLMASERFYNIPQDEEVSIVISTGWLVAVFLIFYIYLREI